MRLSLFLYGGWGLEGIHETRMFFREEATYLGSWMRQKLRACHEPGVCGGTGGAKTTRAVAESGYGEFFRLRNQIKEGRGESPQGPRLGQERERNSRGLGQADSQNGPAESSTLDGWSEESLARRTAAQGWCCRAGQGDLEACGSRPGPCQWSCCCLLMLRWPVVVDRWMVLAGLQRPTPTNWNVFFKFLAQPASQPARPRPPQPCCNHSGFPLCHANVLSWHWHARLPHPRPPRLRIRFSRRPIWIAQVHRTVP